MDVPLMIDAPMTQIQNETVFYLPGLTSLRLPDWVDLQTDAVGRLGAAHRRRVP